MITYIYIICNLALVLILVNVIYHSAKIASIWHFNLIVAFVLLFMMEFEVYREMLRIVGLSVEVSALRVRYLNALYLLIGMFVREVMYNAERYETNTLQGRPRV